MWGFDCCEAQEELLVPAAVVEARRGNAVMDFCESVIAVTIVMDFYESVIAVTGVMDFCESVIAVTGID